MEEKSLGGRRIFPHYFLQWNLQDVSDQARVESRLRDSFFLSFLLVINPWPQETGVHRSKTVMLYEPLGGHHSRIDREII